MSAAAVGAFGAAWADVKNYTLPELRKRMFSPAMVTTLLIVMTWLILVGFVAAARLGRRLDSLRLAAV